MPHKIPFKSPRRYNSQRYAKLQEHRHFDYSPVVHGHDGGCCCQAHAPCAKHQRLCLNISPNHVVVGVLEGFALARTAAQLGNREDPFFLREFLFSKRGICGPLAQGQRAGCFGSVRYSCVSWVTMRFIPLPLQKLIPKSLPPLPPIIIPHSMSIVFVFVAGASCAAG
ncbi:hypothetical protein BO99DRAFT_262758 [Aspergillus violaceofuscus CBS 115571]|uniref:Uncharacterized protein n=1 Tax=Aspergillus violaceofuscus (strain CBS 115571) TaxID=1450538 RepID=A0A2V5H2U9_ASPV1|nr:hypothetical protein BO99DRAFT_262758 [Aspergillus violaceofuscus CBS 115571]